MHRYEPRPDPATGGTVHRAVDWEPFEISIVPLPVDRDAAVRGEAPQGAPAIAVEPALPEEPSMPETTPETPAADPAPPATPPQETTVTTTPPDTTRAVAARAMPGYQAQGEYACSGRHLEFMGWRPSDMVRELLSLHGETQIPRDPVGVACSAACTTLSRSGLRVTPVGLQSRVRPLQRSG